MCGIVAQHGSVEDGELERWLARLTHRGPDDSGSVRVGDAWLGHRRLSIVDLEGGRQPLATSDGDLFLVGNGEVYNHASLRTRLGNDVFGTRSDNEVALHLVDRRGPKALGELNGMFAFCAAGYDGRFVAARDPVGIKPLYWARPPFRDGVTRFASEMHAFDPEWLPYVEAFPPGCAWSPEGGLVRFAAAVPEGAREDCGWPAGRGQPPAELLDEVRDVLVDSVRRQMMGDVPVGVFLSGGLDSSLVAAIAATVAAEHGRTLRTFAVGTPGSPDLVAARVVAEHLGTDHHERVYSAEEAIAALPDVVRAIESFDPSLVRSAVPNFFLAQETAQHVKVVLTGEGADELFAGYGYYHEDFSDPGELHAELVRTVEGLHDLNLQRCDRVTMAFGLEARVPFLDRRVIDWTLRVPAGWKSAGEGRAEKHLLRAAFDGWLPDDLLWRGKAQFGDGSGAADVLTRAVEATVTDEELAEEREAVDPPIRTKEELAYFRILRDHLPGVRPERTIGRFATA